MSKKHLIVTALPMALFVMLFTSAATPVLGQGGTGRETEKTNSNPNSTKKPPAPRRSSKTEKAERERLKREAEENLSRERAERERAERERTKEKEAREAAEAKRKELEALLPNAKIQSVWTDSAVVDGSMGLQVHVKFEVNNLKDFECGLGALFYKPDGEKLKDFNDNFTTTAGHVYTGKNFKPTLTNASYSDFVLFIPYEELHLGQGDYRLKLDTYLRAGDKVLAESEKVEFVVTAAQLAEAQRVATAPWGKIESVRIDHNIDQGGNRGMMIHFKLTFANLKGVELEAVAFFYWASGSPLKGKGKFATTGGNLVTTSDSFTPSLVAGYFEDLRIFMPYKEIRIPKGRHELKFFVSIHGKNIGYFTQSDWLGFWMTQE
jgi:hypothetical protein